MTFYTSLRISRRKLLLLCFFFTGSFGSHKPRQYLWKADMLKLSKCIQQEAPFTKGHPLFNCESCALLFTIILWSLYILLALETASCVSGAPPGGPSLSSPQGSILCPHFCFLLFRCASSLSAQQNHKNPNNYTSVGWKTTKAAHLAQRSKVY